MDYKPREIEQKWLANWKYNETYKVETGGSKPKFYILDMFPYPSGAGLHVGHPLGYIASDILARFKRLQGYNVLHPMGFDAFGLPAEQYALENGIHPEVSTRTNIKRYREQLDNLALSFDWSREVSTCDPEFYKWTQWIFLQMFGSWYALDEDKALNINKLEAIFEREGNEKVRAATNQETTFSAAQWASFSAKERSDILMNYRLMYRKISYVNWCEALGTVLANDEITNGVSERGGHPVTQKPMLQWSMRTTAYAERLLNGLETVDFPDSLKAMQRAWVGKSEGAQVFFQLDGHDAQLEIFTTRADTIFGATFMVIAPEHDLVAEITTENHRKEVEKYLDWVKTRSEIERMSDKKVSGANTGAHVIHPFSGEKIPVFIAEYVLKSYGTGAIMAVPADDERDQKFAEKFGLKIIQVVDKSDYPGATLDEKVGKMINSDFLNGLEVKTAIQKMAEILEEKGLGKRRINYKLRDAGYARQRYWGEPVPIVYDQNDVAFPISEADLPLELPDLDDFTPAGGGKGPLAKLKNWVEMNDGSFNSDPVANPTPDPSPVGRGDRNSANPDPDSDSVANPTPDPSPVGRGDRNSANPDPDSSTVGNPTSDPSPVGRRDVLLDVRDSGIYRENTDAGRWHFLKKYARSMRKDQTEAESIMWEALRGQKLDGLKFRRQHAIHDFIVDFVNLKHQLVIEIDGEIHEFQQEYDAMRTEILNNNHFSVIRFSNKDVLTKKDWVLSQISAKIETLKSSTSPFPTGEGSGVGLAEFRSPLPTGEGSGVGLATGEESGSGLIPIESGLLSKLEESGTGSSDMKFTRETDTMPGFAGSSWYFLRYMDPRNSNAFASREALDYWQDVDFYIGGAEHAVGHLMYSRMWHKFLFDMGLVPTEEPYKKLVNQGMIQGRSNFVYRATERFFEEYLLKKVLDPFLSAYLPVRNETKRSKSADFEFKNADLVIEVKSNRQKKVLEEIQKNAQSQGKRLLVLSTEGLIAHINEPQVIAQIIEKSLQNDVKYTLWGEKNGHEKLFVSFDLTEKYSTAALTKLHVDVNIVDGDQLVIDKTVNVNMFKNANFKLNAQRKFWCSWEIEKMSKSKYNVVNPDDIIQQFGADCFRMYEMFLGPIEQGKPWDTKGITGVTGFLRKFWGLFFDDKSGDFELEKTEPNREEMRILHGAIKRISEDIERFSMNTCVSHFMIATNELRKINCSKRAILEPLVVLLAPFAPHLAEEIWEKMGHKTSVCDASWPVFEENWLKMDSINYPIQINGKLRANLEMPADADAKTVENAVLALDQVQKYLEGKPVRKVIFVPGRMVNLVV